MSKNFLGKPYMQVLIADSQPIFRGALAKIIRINFPDTLVDEAESLEGALQRLGRRPKIGLLLLEYRLPTASQAGGVIVAHFDPPQLLSTVVPSMADAAAANQALQDGSAILMPRSASKRDFIRAIEDLTATSALSEPEPLAHPPGQNLDNPKGLLADRLAHLTQQQRRVVRLVRQGMSNKRIAHVLGVGESTVKAHVTTILRKLQLTSRIQVAVIAITLDPDPGPAAI